LLYGDREAFSTRKDVMAETGEEARAGAEPWGAAGAETGAEIREAVESAASEAAAAGTIEAAATESGEAIRTEARAVEIREEAAAQQDDATDDNREFQRLGEERLRSTAVGASSALNSFRAIVVEANDYSRLSVENGSSFIRELVGADSLESVIRIQSEYAKNSYAGFIAHVTKLASILASSACRPKSSWSISRD
jgi:hypothetical protein